MYIPLLKGALCLKEREGHGQVVRVLPEGLVDPWARLEALASGGLLFGFFEVGCGFLGALCFVCLFGFLFFLAGGGGGGAGGGSNWVF